MSTKKFLLIAAALVLTWPTAALADAVSFSFGGGTLDASGTTLTTMSGTGSASTLGFIANYPTNVPVFTGTLGTVDLATGDFLGNCSTGGLSTCYAAAGSVIQIVASSAFAPGISVGTVLFSGSFVDLSTFVFPSGIPPGPVPPAPLAGTGVVFSPVTCQPSQPAGTYCYRLYGAVYGTLDPALLAALGMTGGPGGSGWIAQIDLLFANTGPTLAIDRGDMLVVVPEPGSLALFGTGLLGIAGLLRRRLA